MPEGSVVALADLDPATAFSGMRVGITGQFDAAHEVLVEPRARDGQDGAWVLTPMQPAGADGTGTSGDPADTVGRCGARVGAGGAAPGAAARGDRRRRRGARGRCPGPRCCGRCRGPADAARGGHRRAVGPRRIPGALGLVRPDRTAGRRARASPVPLLVTELPGAEVGLNWRNAAYAVQWIVFAGFAIFFWNRFRRDYVDTHPSSRRSPNEHARRPRTCDHPEVGCVQAVPGDGLGHGHPARVHDRGRPALEVRPRPRRSRSGTPSGGSCTGSCTCSIS